MSEWKKVKLGDLYTVHNGLSKGRKFFGKGFLFLSFTTVFNHYFIPDRLDSLVLSTEKEREACSIRRGDVFITRTSETMDELGMSCVALKDYPNATYNGFTKRLRPITEEETLPEFIGYYLRSPQFRGKFMAFSAMTTRASLANDQLLSMEICYPNMDQQRKIAYILSRYDSLIDNYQRQIKLLEEAAQRLYKEWFVDLHFPGYENTKIVDGVPEGWRRLFVDEIYSIKYGKNLSTKLIAKKGLFPVYGANGVIGYYHKENCEEKVVLITSRGNGSGDVFRTYHDRCFVTNNSFIVTANKDYSYCKLPFNYFFLKKANFRLVRTGAAQPQLTNQAIHTIQVLLPTEEQIKSFCKLTSSSFSRIDNFKAQLRLLTEARDRLLPKLMSGEIEV